MRKKQKNAKKGPGNSIWALFGGLVIAAFIIGLVAFVISDQEMLQAESQIEKLASIPKKTYGDEIVLTGNVSTVIGTRALIIEGPGVISDEVLIISKTPIVPIGGGLDESLYREGSRVSVSGEARRFDIKRMERELGIDLVDEDFVRWEGKPVIIAETIREDL